MKVHHTSDRVCPSCEAKLLTAEPALGEWFRRLKARYINVHIAWAYRGAEDQEQAFRDRKSNCHYPDSPHNKTKDGKPCSIALDLFQEDEDGVARFSKDFYAKVNAENLANHEPLIWGGDFKTLGDFDHFQLKT